MTNSATQPATLQLSAHVSAPRIDVRRNAAVSDHVWLLFQGEWGDVGTNPQEGITVPLDRFLADRFWLDRICRRYGIGIEVDERTAALLRGANDEYGTLAEILAGGTPADSVSSRPLPGQFTRNLRPFQLRDLSRLLALPHGANFSVPGAGKTTVTYAMFESERDARRVTRLLVVAPLSAFDAWKTEAIESFQVPPTVKAFDGGHIHSDTDVLLVNYQRLIYSYDAIAAWVAEAPTHVVLDEAHRMKRGWAGEWGSACLSLGYLASRRDILTGTPAPNSPRDLEALFDFLWPTQARRILPAVALVRDPPPNVGDAIAAAIRPLFARTTKPELELPVPDYSVVTIPLEGLHREIYGALRRQYSGRFALGLRERVSFSRMGEIVMYLLEAATNPALLVSGSSPYDPIEFRHPPLEIPSDSRLFELLEEYGKYETPAKFTHLGHILRENAEQGRKTLVWTNFVRNLETLKRLLARFRPAVVHGGVPSEVGQPGAVITRESELDRFRRDDSCFVLLANPAALSEGVSLHHVCHDAIYLDRTFNAGQYLQSLDRIHRLGLDPGAETRITFLVSENTVDAVVNSRVEEKARRLGEMLEDPGIVEMALPDDDDYGGPIDDADVDVEALFRHLRGDEAS